MVSEQRGVIIVINAGPCIIAFIIIHNAFIAPLMFDPMKQQLKCKPIFFSYLKQYILRMLIPPWINFTFTFQIYCSVIGMKSKRQGEAWSGKRL